MNPIIVIPARLASNRLPDKPLADIGGKPMIVRVWEKAVSAGIAPVLVACDSTRVSEVIEKVGGKFMLTDPDLPSGSDRIHEALELFDPKRNYDVVINLQGDMPEIDAGIITSTLKLLANPAVDIATAAFAVRQEEEQLKPQNVKVAIAFQEGGEQGRALYFSRARIPYGEGAVFGHVGLYIYRREALRRFVSLPPSPLELREKLEQLRALEAGMRIDVMIVENPPVSVDTPEDLERARRII